MSDNVKHPDHYKEYPKETIDIIRFVLGEEGFKAYCIGNELNLIAFVCVHNIDLNLCMLNRPIIRLSK